MQAKLFLHTKKTNQRRNKREDIGYVREGSESNIQSYENI